MIPDAFAAARVNTFPWDTESERALGRTTITTGTPIASNPVTFATRVMPESLDASYEKLKKAWPR